MDKLTAKRWVLIEGAPICYGWYIGWVVSEDKVKGILLGTVRGPGGNVVARIRFEPDEIEKVWDINPHGGWKS